ncbi:MAG: hypothetical protein IIC93_06545 [Chloroflexi bacterium]|nr:hypothetical protein [Chloroflexota bacterium]
MAEEDRDKTQRSRRLRGTFNSARGAVGSSLDKVSGAAYRRQFERFTNIVETTVVGIHRDQLELDKRLEKLERATPATPSTLPTHKLAVAAFVFSLTAVILAIAALALALSL